MWHFENTQGLFWDKVPGKPVSYKRLHNAISRKETEGDVAVCDQGDEDTDV